MEAELTMRRPASGAPIAGVCAAIAERTGIDPLVIRVAAVLFAVSSGIGVVLYLAGWLLIPREGHDRGPVLETFPALSSAPRWLVMGVLAVALLAVGITVSSLTPASLFPALVVGLVYYFGVHRPRQRGRAESGGRAPVGRTGSEAPTATAFPPPRPFGDADAPEAERPTEVRPATASTAPGPYAEAGPSADPVMSAYLTQPDPAGLYTRPPSTPRAVRLPDPQRLGKRTLGMVTLTAIGLLWTALSLAGSAGQPFPAYVWAGSALIVVGVSLVIGAWVGRPRGLVLASIVLALVATLGAGLQERTIPQPVLAPESVTYAMTEVMPSADAWDVGAPTVDLRELQVTQDMTYDVHINAGALTVLVPESAHVVVNARMSMGSITIGDWTTDVPPAQQVTREVSPGEPGAPTLTINATAEIGELVVKTA